MDRQYPIGPFNYPDQFSFEEVQDWISEIAEVPEKYKTVAGRLSESQWDTAYREGGWTARQVIHHVPDSHMQAYTRFKWVLTEGETTIKPYYEDRWATLPDTSLTPVSVSLQLLESIHTRWTILMRNLNPEDFDKCYIHPEYGRRYALGAVCKLYAWHGKHHLAHLHIIESST